LAEDDQGCVVGGGANVESADEVDSAVAAGAGEPPVVVAGAGAAEDLGADPGGEKFEGVLASVEEGVEVLQQVRLGGPGGG
jgi:hypothetical protein